MFQYTSRHSQCTLLTLFPDHTGVPSPCVAWGSLPLCGLGTRLVPSVRINSTWKLQTLTNKTQITCYTCWDVMMSFPTLVSGLDFWRMDPNWFTIILRNDISMNSITISILSVDVMMTLHYEVHVECRCLGVQRAVKNQWNGMVEWNTGMTFDPNCSAPSPLKWWGRSSKCKFWTPAQTLLQVCYKLNQLFCPFANRTHSVRWV